LVIEPDELMALMAELGQLWMRLSWTVDVIVVWPPRTGVVARTVRNEVDEEGVESGDSETSDTPEASHPSSVRITLALAIALSTASAVALFCAAVTLAVEVTSETEAMVLAPAATAASMASPALDTGTWKLTVLEASNAMLLVELLPVEEVELELELVVKGTGVGEVAKGVSEMLTVVNIETLSFWRAVTMACAAEAAWAWAWLALGAIVCTPSTTWATLAGTVTIPVPETVSRLVVLRASTPGEPPKR